MRSATTSPGAPGGTLELLIAAALGLAALGGAFAAYRNEQHNHKAEELFSLAIREFDRSGQYSAAGNATLIRDQSLFLEYVKARQTGNVRLASYIFSSLMGPTLQASSQHAAGVNGGNPRYQVPELAAASRTASLSEKHFEQARGQQEDADHFTLVEVVLALALFLYGVAGVSSVRRLRLATFAIGLAIFAFALALLLTG